MVRSISSNAGCFARWKRERQSMLFNFASAMVRHRVPGGYRLMDTLASLGVTDRAVRYKITDDISLLVPIYRQDNRIDPVGLRSYEQVYIEAIAGISNTWQGEIILVDCGADIGLYSAKMYSACTGISEIYAFEPNLHVWECLNENLNALPARTYVFPYAVSNANGRGRLKRPSYDQSDHARFIERCPTGTIPIMTIDSLELPEKANLIIKIDVEGTEFEVLKGAKKAIENSQNFIVGFEVHRKVVERVGEAPLIEMLNYINNIKKCKVIVSEDPSIIIERPEELIRKMPMSMKVMNVLCTPVHTQ